MCQKQDFQAINLGFSREISKGMEGAARLLLVAHGEIQEEITNLRKELLNGNEPEFDEFRNSQPIYIAKKIEHSL